MRPRRETSLPDAPSIILGLITKNRNPKRAVAAGLAAIRGMKGQADLRWRRYYEVFCRERNRIASKTQARSPHLASTNLRIHHDPVELRTLVYRRSGVTAWLPEPDEGAKVDADYHWDVLSVDIRGRDAAAASALLYKYAGSLHCPDLALAGEWILKYREILIRPVAPELEEAAAPAPRMGDEEWARWWWSSGPGAETSPEEALRLWVEVVFEVLPLEPGNRGKIERLWAIGLSLSRRKQPRLPAPEEKKRLPAPERPSKDPSRSPESDLL